MIRSVYYLHVNWSVSRLMESLHLYFSPQKCTTVLTTKPPSKKTYAQLGQTQGEDGQRPDNCRSHDQKLSWLITAWFSYAQILYLMQL